MNWRLVAGCWLLVLLYVFRLTFLSLGIKQPASSNFFHQLFHFSFVVMIEPNDATLVAQCLQGDIKAFEAIIDKYQKPVYNVALRIINDRDDAQDAAQMVFIKLYEKLASFDPQRKFFSWLYRMAVNESINLLNQKKRFVGLDERFVASDKTPEESFAEDEMTQQIETALMHLEPEQRALIVLKHFQNLAYEEIAYIMDISEKTVKSRLYSTRQILKNILLKQGFVSNG
jgi:RNA polymerase sigma-70 factor (ECF subfamily)